MSETVNKIAVLSSAVKHALLADVQYYDFHASSAFNRKMKGIITPGFYGGFEPALAGGLNLKITSLQGPGGHGVASVDVNNHQITVQQIEDVTLAIPVNGVTRVMLEANYQYGVKTSQVDDSSDIHAARIFTANISVPLADNHLEICRVTVPADATELTLDMIDSSHRKNKALGITLSSEIDSDAEHIGASSHAVKKAVKAARDETTKQIENLVDGAPASLDTLKKIADAINNDPDFFNTLAEILKLKAPLESPELTGIPTVPTPPLSVSNKQVANTEYVQAAVAALVGSSPEALDTLAELAQALGNDPNFATTMLNALSGKQPLNQILTSLSGLNSAANKLAFFNGPNSMALANLTAVGRVLIGQESIAKVLEYLGLVETVNRAAGALQKELNLNDVPDKSKARAALELGTAAIVDVTTSSTDKTPGRIPVVGWMGNGKSIELFENSNLNNVTSVVATYSVNNPGDSPKNFPVNKPGVLRVSQDSDNRTIQEYTTFNPVVKYERALYSSGSWSGWTAYYSTNNKPNATDVSALALSPASFSTGTDFNNAPAGSTSFAYSVALNSPPEHCAVIDWWGLNEGFRGQLGAGYTSGMLYFRGRNGNKGTWSAWDRLYSVNNPPPATDLSGYATQQWVLQNFVQNIRVSATVVREFRDGWGYSANDAAFATAISMVGGSSNVGSLLVRYAQKQINNNWYNVTE